MTDRTGPTPPEPDPEPPEPPARPEPLAAVVPPSAGVPPAAEVPPPATPGRPGRRITLVVAAIVVVSLLAIGWKAYQDHRDTASVPDKGSCIQVQDTSSNHAKATEVDCSDSAAGFVVLDKIAGGSDHACDPVAGTEAVFTLSRGSTKVYQLCLRRK